MTGPEKTQEIIAQLGEIQKNIEKKNSSITQKIEEVENEKKEIDANPNLSPQQKEKRKKKCDKKIQNLTTKQAEMMTQQNNNARVWKSGVEKEIQKVIKDLALAPVLAMTGI